MQSPADLTAAPAFVVGVTVKSTRTSALNWGTDMNRKRIARQAYTAAADRVLASIDAGALSWDEGRAKLAKLRAAYERRKSDLELSAFARSHGLNSILRVA